MQIKRISRAGKLINLFSVHTTEMLLCTNFGKYTQNVHNMLKTFFKADQVENCLSCVFGTWSLIIVRKETMEKKIVYDVYYNDIFNSEVTHEHR